MLKKASKVLCAIQAIVLTMSVYAPTALATDTQTSKEEYRIEYKNEPVSANKSWKIRFNKEIDSSTVYSNNIYVEDDDNNKISTNVKVDSKNKKVVTVSPSSKYVQGKQYHLVIKNVKATDGKEMKKSSKTYFTVNNVFAGLPGEEGLIIVDNIAYSVEYLAKNSKLKNEVLDKDFHIYYSYKPTEQRIRDVFGNIDVSGSKNTPTFEKRIIYVDSNGDRSIYEWDHNESEYKFVKPSIDAEVTVNSHAKFIMIKVNKVYGVDGATYFKIQHTNNIKRIGESVTYTSSALNEKIEILSSAKTVLASGTISLMYSSSSRKYLSLLKNDENGNTSGNINNNGYVAEDNDGYVFYNNTADRNQIYKLDTNGTFNNSICSDNAQYINTLNGWVYYSNYNENGKIYKVKIDGTQRQRLNEDMSAYLCLSGDWIYYSNHSDGGKLYRIRTDGTNRMKVSSAMNSETAYVNAVGNWIYYTDKNDRHRPYVMNAEGTYVCKLSEEWADSIQVCGDWIYYTSSTGVLSKVKKDGTGNIMPIMGKTRKFDKGFHLNVVDGWIYYSNYNDGGKLYKIRTDGSGDKVKLTDDTVDYINIVKNKIYYTQNGRLFWLPIDTDGTIKGQAVQRANTNNAIKTMNDLNITVPYYDVNLTLREIENKYLPEKVPGIKDDNTMHQFSVEWDRDRVSVRNGIRVYTGDIIGFNRKIRLNLSIPSEMLNETNTITVYNNPGRSSDVVEVKNLYDNNLKANPPKLNVGDEIRIYDDEDLTKRLGNAKVVREGKYNKAIIQRLELDSMGQKSFWVTVIRNGNGKGESRPTEVKQIDMPIILTTKDNDDVGFGADMRDVTIEEWLPSTKRRLDSYYIYLLPNRRQLDMSQMKKSTVKAIKGYGNVDDEDTLYGVDSNLSSFVTSDNKGRLWTGNENMNKDSSFNLIRNGRYDVFVAGKYSSTASPDNRGKNPSVIGYISSEANTVDMVAEGLPNKPVLAKQKVRGGTEITLQTPLKEGETAYLVPVSTLDSISNWMRQDGFDESQLDKSTTGNANGLKPEKLEYDGVSKIIRAPQGMKKNEDRYSDIECKLVYVNDVGASLASDGSIVIDNKPPEITLAEKYKSVFLGEQVKAQSSEDGEIYLVPNANKNSSAEQLKAAVANKTAKVVSVRNNVDYGIDTTGLEGKINTTGVPNLEANYSVVSVDEAGNVSESKDTHAPNDVLVYIETYKFDEIIKEAEAAATKLAQKQDKTDYETEAYVKLTDASRVASETRSSITNVSEKFTTIAQREIDKAFNVLKYQMLDVGIASKYGTIDEIMTAELNSLQNINIDKDTPIQTKSRFITNDPNSLTVDIDWNIESPSDADYAEIKLHDDTTTTGQIYGKQLEIKKYPTVEDKQIPLRATITVIKKENGKEVKKVATKRIIATIRHLEIVSIDDPTVTIKPNGKAEVKLKWKPIDVVNGKKLSTNFNNYKVVVSETGQPTARNIINANVDNLNGTATFEYEKDKYICIGIVVEDEDGKTTVCKQYKYITTRP